MSIPFIDLKAQYQALKPQIQARINTVLEHGQYIMGPEVKELEDKLAAYTGSKHCITVASGTEALLMSLMALGIKPGDEVITTPFTFVATAEVIVLLGAKPIFVDIESDTCNIDANLIEAKITSKTKAIMPVSLYGQTADMDEINAVAARHGNIPVIEDAAQSFGATYKGRKSCNLSTIGCTSFFPSKPLGCYGDGGAIFTNNDNLAHRLRGIVNHGMYQRYYHDEVGVNSRLDSVQAAILRKKLPHLDNYNEARGRAADYYDEAFAGHEHILTPKRAEYSTHVFHQYTLRILNGKRNDLQKFLAEKEIPAMIYYPVALRKQKAYFQESNDADFVNTDKLLDQVISLPMHTELDDEQLKYITDAVLEFMG
jgi:dTDP-4-amino-4,6-dideoxygalactose transaminase